MSIQQVGWVLEHEDRTEGVTRLVLIAIANHDGDGGSWPSVATLAREANCSRRAVQYAVKELVELGLVEVLRNAGGTSETRPDRRTNRYRITRGATPCTPSDQPVDGAQSETERGATHDTTGRNLRPNGVHTSAPEPSLTALEPSAEPKIAASRERDDLFEAVCGVCKIDWSQLTPSGRGPLNRAVAELRGLHVAPEEVARRAMNYKLRYPDIELTPSALAKHWAGLGEAPVSMSKRELGNRRALAEATATRRTRRKEIKP